MACTVEIVDDEHAAIDHIHQHGRHVNVFFPTIMMLAFPTLHKHAHTDMYSLWIYCFFFLLLTVHILIV